MVVKVTVLQVLADLDCQVKATMVLKTLVLRVAVGVVQAQRVFKAP